MGEGICDDAIEIRARKDTCWPIQKASGRPSLSHPMGEGQREGERSAVGELNRSLLGLTSPSCEKLYPRFPAPGLR
jgi:hypothetical protein